MPFDPGPSPAAERASVAAQQPAAAPGATSVPQAPPHEWQTAQREWLPFWQQRDPVPPPPATAPEIETPGEVLTERQEAFCRAYVECPVAGKAAVAAGYAAVGARKQASRLLKHPLVLCRIHALREVRGKDHQVRRDTIIDQAEAVFEAAMEKHDYYAAMQALTMKARLAGFADYLPGVRILRRDPRDYEQEFWARAHAAEQRLMAARLGDIAGAAIAGGVDGDAAHGDRDRDGGAALEAAREAAMLAEGAEAAADRIARGKAGEAERRARAKRGLGG